MVPFSVPMSAVMLLFGVASLIIIMLLPALTVLKRSKDANPRILENEQHGISLLVNMENDVKFDWAIVRRVAEIIAILPSLEP